MEVVEGGRGGGKAVAPHQRRVPLDAYNPLLSGCRSVEHYERVGMIAQVGGDGGGRDGGRRRLLL